MKRELIIGLAAGLIFGASTAVDAETILGTGTGALLGGDLTDPENDGVESEVNPVTGFDWVSIDANQEAYFTLEGGGVNEGSFDIFDNKVGGGEAKYCCGGPTWNVTVQFDQQYTLTHFTATSSNDSPGRDPDVWQILGSNDGVNWVTIFSEDNDAAGSPGNGATHQFWTARNQVIRFDGGGADFETPAGYSWFRLNVDSAAGTTGNSGGNLALGELELFGNPIPEPTSLAVLCAGLLGLHRRGRRIH